MGYGASGTRGDRHGAATAGTEGTNQMTYRIDIDYDHDAHTDYLEMVAISGARVVEYTRHGPGGGNPNAILEVATSGALRIVYDFHDGGMTRFVDWSKLHVKEG